MRKILAAALALTLACGAVYAPGGILANIGITMFDDSTIKVNCYGHNCLLVFDSGGKGTKNYP